MWLKSPSRQSTPHSNFAETVILQELSQPLTMRFAHALAFPSLAAAAALPLEAALGAIKPDPKTVQIKGVSEYSVKNLVIIVVSLMPRSHKEALVAPKAP